MLGPILLPKQLWSVEAQTPLDLWRCVVVSGTKMLAPDPLSPVGLPGGAFMGRTCLSSTSCRWLIDWIEIWGILVPDEHFKLVLVLLKPLLNNFYFVAGRDMLLERGHREYFFSCTHCWGSDLTGLQLCSPIYNKLWCNMLSDTVLFEPVLTFGH